MQYLLKLSHRLLFLVPKGSGPGLRDLVYVGLPSGIAVLPVPVPVPAVFLIPEE